MTTGTGELAAQAASLAGVGEAYRTRTVHHTRVISPAVASPVIKPDVRSRRAAVAGSRSSRRIGDAARK